MPDMRGGEEEKVEKMDQMNGWQWRKREDG